jgi:hypothetical protein
MPATIKNRQTYMNLTKGDTREVLKDDARPGTAGEAQLKQFMKYG